MAAGVTQQLLPPAITQETARSEFIGGVKGVAPILLGVIPFGMIYGVLAIGAGLSVAAAQSMSFVVFAGSAQFVASQMFRIGTPPPVMVATTLIINLRHMLYSASVAPYLRHLSWRWKALLAYLLTDEAYAVAIVHYQQTDDAAEPSPHRHWYFLGAGLGLWTTWQLSTAVGIAVGAEIPASWSLDFTLALTFIALVVPGLKDRPSLGAALAAGTVAVVGAAWPYKLGLIAAALAGIVVGLLLEMAHQERTQVDGVTAP